MIFIQPQKCIPPHRISHPNKLYELANKFVENGWGDKQESLVGYFIGKDLQLLSGTHRHGAAILAGLETIPVTIKYLNDVEESVGDLDRWKEIMRAEICDQKVLGETQ